MVDILHEIFPSNQYDVSVTFLPLKRAMLKAEYSKFDGFIGGDKSQIVGNLFPKYVTTPNNVYFYKLQSSAWKYSDLSQLKNEKILAVKDIGYANPEVDKYIQTNQFNNILYVSAEKHLEQMISLISKKRYTAFLGGDLNIKHTLFNHSSNNKIVNDKFLIGVFKNYISINPKQEDANNLVKRINSEFLKIYKSGKLKEIYKKYGVSSLPKMIK
jgi:ABC-type amino acid transport substrate-binding protein